eukprot:scaffold6377_cov125-Isochrysis_galbana.AAC.2
METTADATPLHSYSCTDGSYKPEGGGIGLCTVCTTSVLTIGWVERVNGRPPGHPMYAHESPEPGTSMQAFDFDYEHATAKRKTLVARSSSYLCLAEKLELEARSTSTQALAHSHARACLCRMLHDL